MEFLIAGEDPKYDKKQTYSPLKDSTKTCSEFRKYESFVVLFSRAFSCKLEANISAAFLERPEVHTISFSSDWLNC